MADRGAKRGLPLASLMGAGKLAPDMDVEPDSRSIIGAENLPRRAKCRLHSRGCSSGAIRFAALTADDPLFGFADGGRQNVASEII